MKYEVTIFDDGSKLANIERFLKKAHVKFDTESLENDYACKGVEVLGFEIKFRTSNDKVMETIKKNWINAHITAYKVHKGNFKKFYTLRWIRRNQEPEIKNNVMDIPF